MKSHSQDQNVKKSFYTQKGNVAIADPCTMNPKHPTWTEDNIERGKKRTNFKILKVKLRKKGLYIHIKMNTSPLKLFLIQ